MSCTDLINVEAMLVAHEFIDEYMPDAGGDYVKVYLYMLRHADKGADIAQAAEALRLSEGDVRRAIVYWQEKGILSTETAGASGTAEAEPREGTRKRAGKTALSSSQANAGSTESAASSRDKAAPEKKPEGTAQADRDGEIRDRYRRAEGRVILDRLEQDSEFGQLLFIVQKYRSKILTEREQEVLAYLYDGLHLPCDVIDYLVDYCVNSGHNNMRYIEKTGLDWAAIGIRDVPAAKRRTAQFEEALRAGSAKKSAKDAKQGIERTGDLDAMVQSRLFKSLGS